MAQADDLTNFINALQNENARIQRDRPKDSHTVATVVLMSGEEVNNVTEAYPVRPDMLAFAGVRNRKAITMIVRYENISHCVFRVEKGKRKEINFSLGPPQIGFRSGSRPPDLETA